VGNERAVIPFEIAQFHPVPGIGATPVDSHVLLCQECRSNESGMEALNEFFKNYLASKINEAPDNNEESDDDIIESEPGLAKGGKIKITINWGLLDVDRQPQTIAKGKDSSSVAELMSVLIKEFGDSMKEQLMRIPVLRSPLSENPKDDFMRSNSGRLYAYSKLPDITPPLYICTHSSQMEKIQRLTTLFERLELPDGNPFPEESIKISVDDQYMEQ
jgi:hypothetical protein